MKSFNSFSLIHEDSIKLFDLIGEHYHAHTSDGKKDETLKEHTKLVSNYLFKLVQYNGIDEVIENCTGRLGTILKFETREISKDYCKRIFYGSIILHDIGKVNPNFQVRIKNSLFKLEKLEQGHNHSFLGAFIFANYFFELIFNDNGIKDDKLFLYIFTLLFSNPIQKHHSSKLDIKNEFEINILNEAYLFLKKFNISSEKDFSLSFFTDFKLIKNAYYEKSSSESDFVLFTLLKLSYSLLTASDYYATNEYKAGMQVDDFGVLTDEQKHKIATNFKTLKPYNAELYNKMEEFNEKPFSELKDRSKVNLNLLRQKLNAEVILNLRANHNNYWYYIEAPTGAGKTNISLACIAELLQLDSSLNKVFYVFPFTTLITQTFQAIQDTIGLNHDEMIQLHSKSGFHSKEDRNDGAYGDEKRLYLDNLFVLHLM